MSSSQDSTMCDWAEKLQELYGWTGSKHAEKHPDLYSFLCSLIGYLIAGDEAAARLEHLDRAQQWQPIETAPKDGSSILAIWMWGDDLNSEQGASSHAIIYWDCGMWLTISGELPPIPTHWMPLPEPPAQSGNE